VSRNRNKHVRVRAGVRRHLRRIVLAAGTISALALAGPATALAGGGGGGGSFVGPLNTIDTLTSTVPINGDVNPYGIVIVPSSRGSLQRGNLLISNFNDMANAQGTGTTIDQITPDGQPSLFAQIDPSSLPGPCPGGVGLTTALAALPSGFVVVGSLPTSDGSSATAQAGCLLVLDSRGKVVETLSGGPINGPWDMTSVTDGPITTLFFTNVLNGTVAASPNTVNGGTVVRLRLFSFRRSAPIPFDEDVIATGFGERTDPAALVIGPTGVGLGDHGDVLYVADTLGNRIAAIRDPLDREHPERNAGRTVTVGGSLNGPLGLNIAPDGNILTVNSNDGNLVETTPDGTQVSTKLLDSTPPPPPATSPLGAGTLFGLVSTARPPGVFFVDDGDNTLRLLH
jgi:hypothetical protein